MIMVISSGQILKSSKHLAKKSRNGDRVTMCKHQTMCLFMEMFFLCVCVQHLPNQRFTSWRWLMSWPSMEWKSALHRLQRLSSMALVQKYPLCGQTNMPADFWTLSQSVLSDHQPLTSLSPNPYRHPPDVLLWPLLCQWLLDWWQ